MAYQKASHEFTPFLRITVRTQRIVPKTLTLTAPDIAAIINPDKASPGNIPNLLRSQYTQELPKHFYVPLVVVPKATESVNIYGNQTSAIFSEGDLGFFDTDTLFLENEILNKTSPSEIIQNVKKGLLVETDFIVTHKLGNLTGRYR